MIYENELWVKIVKGQKVTLTEKQKQHVEAIVAHAERAYVQDFRIKRKQSRKQLIIVGILLDRVEAMHQAIINLKQDNTKLRFMKIHNQSL